MINKILPFILLFMLAVGFLKAQTEGFTPSTNPTVIINKLNEASKTIQTIQSDFTQEKVMSVFSEKIKSKGLFYYKKTNLLRWEYTDPFKYLIIINDQKIYIKDEKKGSEFDMKSNKMFKEINNIMLGSVQGTLLNDTKNYKSKLYENKTAYLVELSPLNAGLKEYIKTIYLYFDKKEKMVTKIRMNESTEDYMLIAFTNRKLNTNIPTDKFSFK